MTNANKVGPTSEQLNRQQAAGKDKNLLASTNKGKPNQEESSRSTRLKARAKAEADKKSARELKTNPGI